MAFRRSTNSFGVRIWYFTTVWVMWVQSVAAVALRFWFGLVFFFNTKMPKWSQLKKKNLENNCSIHYSLSLPARFLEHSLKWTQSSTHPPQEWPTKYSAPLAPGWQAKNSFYVHLPEWALEYKERNQNGGKKRKKKKRGINRTNHEGKNSSDLCPKSATTQPRIGSPAFLFYIPGLWNPLLLLATSVSHPVPAGSHHDG